MRSLWIVLCAACSSSSFEIAQTSRSDSATTTDDTSAPDAVPDAVAEDTAMVAPETLPPADGGCVDPKPKPPPCLMPNADFAAQIDVPGGGTVATLSNTTQIGFHMRMPRDGRVGKVTVRMIPASVGGGYTGTVSLQAIANACVPKALHKVTLPFAAQELWTFEFNGVTALPPMSAGDELSFVLTTDSEAWQFAVQGSGTPSPNPYDLFFAKRMGTTGDFTPVTSKMMSIKVYTYTC